MKEIIKANLATIIIALAIVIAAVQLRAGFSRIAESIQYSGTMQRDGLEFMGQQIGNEIGNGLTNVGMNLR